MIGISMRINRPRVQFANLLSNASWGVGATNAGDVTVTVTGTEIVLTQLAADANGHWARQSIATVIGGVYRLGWTYVGTTGSTARIVRAGTSEITAGTGVIQQSSGFAVGLNSFDWTATATTSLVAVGGALNAGGTITYRDVYLRRIG